MKIQNPLPKKQYLIVYNLPVEAGTVIAASNFNEAELLAKKKWSNRFNTSLPTYGLSATPIVCMTDRLFLEEHAKELIDEELRKTPKHWIHFLKTAIRYNLNGLKYFSVFLCFAIKVVDPVPVWAIDEEDFQDVVKNFEINQSIIDRLLTLHVIEDDEDKSGFWFNVDMDKIKILPKPIK